MANHIPFHIAGILLLLTASVSCVTTGSPEPAKQKPMARPQPPAEQLLYSVFLIGDGGEVSRNPLEPTLQVLQNKLQKAGPQSAVVFLGDNIYPSGLPPAGADYRPQAEQILRTQMDILEGYPGQVLFLAGNHDWDISRKGGWAAVLRQESFVESYLNRGNTFLPDSGRPGPVQQIITHPPSNSQLQIVALDTQWWLHPYQKPGGTHEAAAKRAFVEDLRAILADTTFSHRLVVGHHPIYSKGPHGGNFPLKTHLLPPVGGSLYVMFRNTIGLTQDIAYNAYQQMARRLSDIFSHADPIVYASGHDHSLQYITFEDERKNQHYIISGSASRTTFAGPVEPPQFSQSTKGFARLKYYRNSLWVEYWSEAGNLLFEQELTQSR